MRGSQPLLALMVLVAWIRISTCTGGLPALGPTSVTMDNVEYTLILDPVDGTDVMVECAQQAGGLPVILDTPSKLGDLVAAFT